MAAYQESAALSESLVEQVHKQEKIDEGHVQRQDRSRVNVSYLIWILTGDFGFSPDGQTDMTTLDISVCVADDTSRRTICVPLVSITSAVGPVARTLVPSLHV